MKNVSVKLSEGRGNGLFADRSFKQNQDIIGSNYRTISSDEMAVLRRHDISLALYLFADREEHSKNPETCSYHYIFGAIPMLNHSSSPNCRLVWESDHDIPTVRLVARRDIAPDEELFIEYKNQHVFPESFV